MTAVVVAAVFQYLGVVHQVLVLDVVSSSDHEHDGLKQTARHDEPETFTQKNPDETKTRTLCLFWFVRVKALKGREVIAAFIVKVPLCVC